MSRDACGPEGPPEGAYSNAIPGGWLGYAPLPDEGDPPDESYSRVTNSERFRPLHGAALGLVERLKAEYDVEVIEGYDLTFSGVNRGKMARPPVRMTPNDPECAPIMVAFTNYPGVRVRFGMWKEEQFPECDCDECDDEISYMTNMFESVVAGGLLEAIGVPELVGDGKLGTALKDLRDPMTESEFAADLEFAKRDGRLAEYKVFGDDMVKSVRTSYEDISVRRVKRSRALEMSGGSLYLRFDWKPWPRRRHFQNGESKV